MKALDDESLDWAHGTEAPDAERIAEGLNDADPKVRARGFGNLSLPYGTNRV